MRCAKLPRKIHITIKIRMMPENDIVQHRVVVTQISSSGSIGR